MSNVPIMMMPLAEAMDKGIVREEQSGGKSPLLGRNNELATRYDPLKHLKYNNDIKYDEDNHMRVQLGPRLLSVWGCPLKKYRGKLFDSPGFNRILSKHKVAPVGIGTKLCLLKWEWFPNQDDLTEYMWSHHEINLFYDGGYPREPINAVEEPKRKRSGKVSGMPEERRSTLFDLLIPEDEMEKGTEAEPMPDGSEDGKGNDG
jgi:hypothetical protein